MDNLENSSWIVWRIRKCNCTALYVTWPWWVGRYHHSRPMARL